MWEVPFVRKTDDLALAASHLPQSSASSRFTAGASAFFILSQSSGRSVGEFLRFETMPSSPSLQAWAKTVGPSPSMLDFVQPLAAGWQFVGFGREARRDEPGREGTLQHVG
jgi:hypothetical protein